MDDRIERLERQVRSLRACLLVTVAVGVAAGLIGAANVPEFDEVRARRFVLVDEQGQRRAELGPLPDTALAGPGGVGLRIAPSPDDDSALSTLGVSPDGIAYIELGDVAGGSVLHAFAGSTNAAALMLGNRTSESNVLLRLEPEGRAHVDVMEGTRDATATLAADAGRAGLVVAEGERVIGTLP